jgi:hypothetical protein
MIYITVVIEHQSSVIRFIHIIGTCGQFGWNIFTSSNPSGKLLGYGHYRIGRPRLTRSWRFRAEEPDANLWKDEKDAKCQGASNDWSPENV